MLHGWARDSRSLFSYAVEFAQMGYRVIIPDLRGHGQSGGEWLSFGALESDDIRQLLDHLQLDKVDVFGFSLGAATGLHLAAKDKIVNRVIAIASMHSIEQTIPKFGSRSRPWIAWLLQDEEENIVDSGNDLTGLDLQITSNTLAAAEQLMNPTLLVYGGIDQMSDKQLNQSIYDTLNGPKEIQGIEELRHTHLLQHQTALTPVVAKWLGLTHSDNKIVDSSCRVSEYQLPTLEMLSEG
jgi:pimeloyl-ACP methyl ester carboxylesterase